MLLLLAVVGVPAVWAQGGGVADLSWLAGHWRSQMGRAALEEVWIAPAGGAMLGVSRTIARERMVAFEFLRIETRADGTYYVAQPGGRPPTAFKLTRLSGSMAVFENPQHDHPKVITYQLEGANTLVAAMQPSTLQSSRFSDHASPVW